VQAQNHSYDGLKKGIEKSLDLINFSYDRNAGKIVIKPNMCYYYHPSTGEVTNPQFVSALIDVFRENFARDSEIFVVESDASAMKCKYAFQMLEYDKLAEEKNVKLVDLSLEKSRIVNVNVRDSRFKFHIPELLYEADLIVNVPKPKYMKDVKITCALKNMYGCNAYARKHVYHRMLNEAIVGINKIVKTNLVVLDGIIVSGEYTKRLNLVMASEDPVAADAAASRMMGIAPRTVRQIVLASQEGIGCLDFSPIGDFSYFKKIFPKKTLKDNMRAGIASVYLQIFRE
jgi:uncharacterized protein (DUF362 family)